MSYRTWPDGTIHDYFRPLDIKALQEIWGDPDAPFMITGSQIGISSTGPIIYRQNDGSYNIHPSIESTVFTPLTDTKGKAWSSATPIGVEATSTGYNLITETVGKKGSTFSEYSVSIDGEVSKKGAKLTSLQLVGEEVGYNADLNQDGSIGLLPAGDRADYGSGSTSLYEISGVGYGIANENNLIIELKDGPVDIELFPEVAPLHVERVKFISREGAYDNVAFHRVIGGFMAQTGDIVFGALDNIDYYDLAGTGGSVHSGLPDLPAEFSDIPFDRGIVGMARSSDPNSANTQFFITFQDYYSLNGSYTVIGKVTDGMNFVDAIKKGDSNNNGAVTNPDYMLSVHLDYLKPLTDMKGNAWSYATPIGIAERSSSGFKMITETAGKKGSTYTEYTVLSLIHI